MSAARLCAEFEFHLVSCTTCRREKDGDEEYIVCCADGGDCLRAAALAVMHEMLLEGSK